MQYPGGRLCGPALDSFDFASVGNPAMPSLTILLIPSALQALAMLVDESVFHRRRGLLKSERIGHPLDAVIVAACYAWLLSNPEPSERALTVYVVLAAASCILITRDEFAHARACEPTEH